MDLPGYDAWRLASPENYEREGCDCGEEDCPTCAAEAACDRWVDQQIDEAREREWERGVGR